jgi:DNA-binding beta-propeller fold protein YncE
MKRRRRGERILLLVIVGLTTAALVVLYLTAPPPTVLAVRVIDAETGAPLAGAQVGAGPRNGLPLPVLLTDNVGIARFENAPPDPAYSIQVQKVGYDLASGQNIAVAEGRDTEIGVPLTPHAGGRLFVGLDRARVAQIDTSSLLTMQTIVLPGAPEAPVRHLRVHPGGDFLYAVAGAQGYILDGETGALLGRLEIDGTIESLDLSADGQYLLVSNVRDDYASGILSPVHLLTLDARTGELVADTLLADASPATEVAWWPAGTNLEVLAAGSRAVRALAARSWGPLSLERVPVRSTLSHNGAVLSADEQYLFTWFTGYAPEKGEMVDMLAMICTGDGTMMHEEFPAGITALAASPTNQELYVLNGRMGTLTILDLSGARPQTLISVGKNPEALSLSRDGTWAYVANRESQTISSVHLPSSSVVLTVPLPGEPLSLAVR